MPQTSAIVVDNSFIGGLKTEFTGLNFPENACVDTSNCVFNRTGLVTRRLGFDYELNFVLAGINRQNKAIATYHWKNVKGDDQTSFLVLQVGRNLYFFETVGISDINPVSSNRETDIVDINAHAVADPITTIPIDIDESKEAQFADGDGFLFVFHPGANPFYVSYKPELPEPFTSISITLKTRDLTGIPEDVEDNTRPLDLTAIHTYNLANQGWNKTWESISTSTESISEGTKSVTIAAGLPIFPGDRVRMYVNPGKSDGIFMVGVVTSYSSGGALTLNITTTGGFSGGSFSNWTVTPEPALIKKWKEDVGNYPSNADVWKNFINSDIFAPLEKIDIVTTGAGPAPKGFHILDAFFPDRSKASGIGGIGPVVTIFARPTTGAWFAGRVWYSGINTQGYNEKIYFSQIIEDPRQFGKCYQVNDPTSNTLFDILPSDGGTVVIQGSGTIRKLFPMVNGMLVFADRGIWFITGSQGIGFTATDYTITKLSAVPALTHTSFVTVQGTPFFWNEDAIYSVGASKEGGMQVTPITKDTISTFYDSIPLASKKWVRGAYNTIDHKIQWLYSDVSPTDINSRYFHKKVLNLDLQTGAFYVWDIGNNGKTTINDVVVLPSGDNQEETFKYITSSNESGTFQFTFSEERDTGHLDWASTSVSKPYESFMITGYRVYGQGMKRTQIQYVDVHAKGGDLIQCALQSRWDNTSTGNLGKWSSTQNIAFGGQDYDYITKRRRTRGSGRSVQFKFSSVDQYPMSLIGWSTQVLGNKVP